jgi:hypothetical protein
MPRPHTRYPLSRDLVAALRHHCFGNLRAFYMRHGPPAETNLEGSGHLTISLTTFYKALQGEAMSQPTNQEIELLAHRLHLLDLDQGEEGRQLASAALLRHLCQRLDKLAETGAAADLLDLLAYYNKIREKLKLYLD